MGSEDLERGSS